MAKKTLRRIGRILLVLFVLLNIIMAFNAWKFTHFYNDPSLRGPQPTGVWPTTRNILFGQSVPKRLNDSTPSIPFEKVILTDKDGLKLEGWSMKATNNLMKDTIVKDKLSVYSPLTSSNDSIIYTNRGTVILFHGHGSCRSAVLKEAYGFLNFGYNVFMIDFRAHGDSEGEQATVGIKEADDVRTAYQYVKDQTHQEPILWGISLGAATITRAIAQYNLHPQKVILEMPFGSLYDGVKGFMRIKHLPQGLAPFITFWGGTLNGVWAFGHKPSEFAKQITCPVLLQWGQNDPRVTRGEIDEIFANLHTTQKKLVVYETCAHESLCAKEPTKWETNVQEFLHPK